MDIPWWISYNHLKPTSVRLKSLIVVDRDILAKYGIVEGANIAIDPLGHFWRNVPVWTRYQPVLYPFGEADLIRRLLYMCR